MLPLHILWDPYKESDLETHCMASELFWKRGTGLHELIVSVAIPYMKLVPCKWCCPIILPVIDKAWTLLLSPSSEPRKHFYEYLFSSREPLSFSRNIQPQFSSFKWICIFTCWIHWWVGLGLHAIYFLPQWWSRYYILISFRSVYLNWHLKLVQMPFRFKYGNV